MNRALKIVLPGVLLAAIVGGPWVSFATAPAIEARPPTAEVPIVEVAARTESDLVVRIVEIAPSLVSGGYVDAVSLRIDPTEDGGALERARAIKAPTRRRDLSPNSSASQPHFEAVERIANVAYGA